MLGVFLKKNIIMLEYIDYKEVFLKLFFSYRTFLYAFLIYYLIKNRSDWKRMSYQLFAVNIFLSIISLVVNIYPLNLKGLEFFYFFGYASGIYFFYGLVAYFLETDKAPRYDMNIWVLLLVSVFSLGAYVPIWIMKKYKQYNINTKYFWIVLVYLYLYHLRFNFIGITDWNNSQIGNLNILYIISISSLIIWTIVILFFLQEQIEKKSKIIQFRNWYFTLLFGIFYIQYKINDEVQFWKRKGIEK